MQNQSFLDFNSIKVRLELGKTTSVQSLATFQFHKGAIRTVTIDGETRHCVLNFNSIKVRLELSILGINYYHSIFQFHKGAIRTEQKGARSNSTEISIP